VKGSIIIGRNFISYDGFQAKLSTSSLACCRVFRPGSRPLLNGSSDTTPQSIAEATLKTAAVPEIW